MKFKIDENLPVEFAHVLRAAGYDAVTVLDEGMGGRVDASIGEACKEEGRIIVTLDRDFADIRSYPPSEFSGLIVLTLHKQDKPRLMDALAGIIAMLAREPVEHRLWIVQEARIRIRST